MCEHLDINKDFMFSTYNGQHKIKCETFCALLNNFQSFEKSDLEKLGQGQTVQHSKWFHAMPNFSLYKSHT